MISFILQAAPVIIFVLILIYVFSLRRIVPTNFVHIVQRGKNTVSYGVGKESNVYYEFPKWLPIFGVDVRILPVSNFDIDLPGYSAYDKDRVPFMVDVKAFFHIKETNQAAEKVASYDELKEQLINVVQGTVRSILAQSNLEDIMEDRSVFGNKFTEAVKHDLENWGVEAIKNIELMDIRDAPGSEVIHQMMAKRMSAISMESRVEVAKNNKLAQQAELEAVKEIELTTADTARVSGEAQAASRQAIKIADANSLKMSGIAEQASIKDIAEAERATAEQQMEVIKVNQIKQAQIDKDKAIISADQEREVVKIRTDAKKYMVETDALAQLEANKRQAEGIQNIGESEAAVIKAKGISAAESKKAMELASVTAQTTLAQEIGANKEYQTYMIEVKKVEVSQVIGVAQAESLATALSKADLKLLVNSGDVHSGIGKFADLFTSKGGSQIAGLFEGLNQTEDGKKLLSVLERLAPKDSQA